MTTMMLMTARPTVDPKANSNFDENNENNENKEKEYGSERGNGSHESLAPYFQPTFLKPSSHNHSHNLKHNLKHSLNQNQQMHIDAMLNAQRHWGNRAVQRVMQHSLPLENPRPLENPGKQNQHSSQDERPSRLASTSSLTSIQRYCGHPACKDPNCKDPTSHEKVGTTQGCGAPGCTDPNCHDTSAHGFNRVFDLREGPLYSSNLGPSDVGTGTDTSKHTRQYVNSPTTTYPQEISMSYSGPSRQGYTEFENEPSKKADAGHIRSKQTGGFGDDRASVFPQNPQQNEGHKLDGESTFSQWRKPEDEIRHQAEEGSVTVSTVLRDEPRDTYTDDKVTAKEEKEDKDFVPEKEKDDDEEEYES